MHPLLQGRAVLFDVDGTIAETEGDGHLPAFNRAFQEAGLPWSWTSDQYAELLSVTGGFERMMTYVAGIGGEDIEQVDFQKRLRQIHQRKNEIYAELLEAGRIAPRPGCIELMAQIARSSQPWAVVTTTSRANWQALWDHSIAPRAELLPPKMIICGEDVSKKKPDPEAYLLALARLGLQPQQAVAIEDSGNGVNAALGAGIPVIVVRSLFFRDQLFDRAQMVVDELTELL
jgi:HAD superfamily hydrolase (TIGR01509 family)